MTCNLLVCSVISLSNLEQSLHEVAFVVELGLIQVYFLNMVSKEDPCLMLCYPVLGPPISEEFYWVNSPEAQLAFVLQY